MDEKSDLKLLLRLQYARFLTNVHSTFVLQNIGEKKVTYEWEKNFLIKGLILASENSISHHLES